MIVQSLVLYGHYIQKLDKNITNAHCVVKHLLNFLDSKNTYELILVRSLLSVKFVIKSLLAIINLKCMVMCILMIDLSNAIIVSLVLKIEGI